MLSTDAKNLTFHSPLRYIFYLAVILVVERLYLLKSGNPSTTREINLSIPGFKGDHANNIADGSLTPLTEVSRQLAYERNPTRYAEWLGFQKAYRPLVWFLRHVDRTTISQPLS